MQKTTTRELLACTLALLSLSRRSTSTLRTSDYTGSDATAQGIRHTLFGCDLADCRAAASFVWVYCDLNCFGVAGTALNTKCLFVLVPARCWSSSFFSALHTFAQVAAFRGKCRMSILPPYECMRDGSISMSACSFESCMWIRRHDSPCCQIRTQILIHAAAKLGPVERCRNWYATGAPGTAD